MKKNTQPKIKEICEYKNCSPYTNEDLGYNWLNYSYSNYHKHKDFWELLVITDGKTDNLINNTNYRLCTGDIVLLRPQDAHSVTNCKNVFSQHLSVLIKSEYLQQYLASFSNQLYNDILIAESPIFYKVQPNTLNDIIETILNIRSISLPLEEKILKLKLKVNFLINLILDQLLSTNKNFPVWLNKFLFTLNNPKMSIENVKDLATQTNYSYQRLSVIFKQYTGKTIIEYTTDIKMKHAKELLLNSPLSITEIAMELNYDSISHFIRLFKKKYNLTPKQFQIVNKFQ